MYRAGRRVLPILVAERLTLKNFQNSSDNRPNMYIYREREELAWFCRIRNRWQRAEKLGLDPPQNVLKTIMTNPNLSECLWISRV